MVAHMFRQVAYGAMTKDRIAEYASHVSSDLTVNALYIIVHVLQRAGGRGANIMNQTMKC